ncbi:quinoprotein relay system zinc metallohydrolase 1 [Neptuniibacter sp. CAU 1671]|uniref:quinoprotein relay system zinc metallohydrolase 1 n=1 Tax=Neptuniibacter sp. CAU 1671 TaxID=3032593 RepID=UPI0023D9A1AD|nr:quinoprotein relay system zinc metallohydrolase 1 [Neptuniibacter sp. CAU 1671]MDF2180747.1 quinoprotein relay system zinc metallohydrolase 1 [Neptuniibacter sp. CAU 1671]
MMNIFNTRNLISITLALFTSVAVAAPLSYDLKPQKIAEDTWLLEGKLEDFTLHNGGNIVNTAFIVTDEGVIVIDTGPSFRYGREMRQAIEQITDKPVKHVFITHSHPDHYLGNQAFKDATIWALPETGRQIAENGNAFAENMYRLVGDWMRSTESTMPNKVMNLKPLSLGKHTLTFMALTGHTGSDLVILDHATGVMFASDMVFYQRALTTPHTPGLKIWLKEIQQLRATEHKLLVPGHGPMVNDGRAFDQMEAYLTWLDNTLTEAADAGLSMTEVIELPVPDQFKGIALTQREFVRTVAHLYPKYEEAAFN